MTATELACDEQPVGIVVIHLGSECGSADRQTLVELEGHLLEAIDRSPAGLLVDLDETTYVGCEVLNILLRCFVRARENDCSFVLCALDSLPQSVFAITHLDSLWEIFCTRQDAIEAMQPPLGNECLKDAKLGEADSLESDPQQEETLIGVQPPSGTDAGGNS